MSHSASNSTGDVSDLDFMSLALEEAQKCEPKVPGFSVGCVLVVRRPHDAKPVALARGYSRELQGNTHAEANALEKARRMSKDDLRRLLASGSDSAQAHLLEDVPSIDTLLRSSEVFTTMEPCSVRLSGLAPCADALIQAGVSRCVIGVAEPDDFVVCDGAKKLADAGIQVVWLKGLERECLEVARRGHVEGD